MSTWPVTPRDKREELKTYRELALCRDLKSIRQRSRMQASGQRRVIGNGTGTQPFLAVETKRYRAVRLEVQHRLLLEARGLDLKIEVDLLLNQLQPRIEALTYAQLAEEASQETLARLPVAALGRALTTGERTRFAESRAVAPASEKKEKKATSFTPAALDRVLGQIDQRQSHNPARYQTIWAQVVGAEIAQQTHLEQVDATTQIAWFRCLNSVLSSDLQRRPGLVEKLSKALGKPVRKLRARF